MTQKWQVRRSFLATFWAKVSIPVAVAALLLPAMLVGASAQAQTYNVLNTFNGTDGSSPAPALVMDASGNLYGTTYFGGTSNVGVVFKLDSSGSETVLRNFKGAPNDGAKPFAGVARDQQGNIYGVTSYGGANGLGAIFKIDTAGHETLLHSFVFAEGTHPQGTLILDVNGNLYGTAIAGGNLCSLSGGCGTVFKLDTAGNLSVLHKFTGSDGARPNAGLVMGPTGNVYGTAFRLGPFGHGSIFRIKPDGTFTVLFGFRFGALSGAYPFAGLTLDSSGNLYGTTVQGGSTADMGVVFSFNLLTFKETVLHVFTGGADGAHPFGGVVRDGAGNLYGITTGGGNAGCSGYGCGTVFKLDSVGNKTVLYAFKGGADGANPYAGPILDSAGNLYGTAPGGGSGDHGTVYKITP